MDQKKSIRVLCIGDVFGDKGVRVALHSLLKYKNDYDFVVANIENASQKSGSGISEYAYRALKEAGVSVFTGGNHSFQNRNANFLYEFKDLLRPCNFPAGVIGHGHGMWYIEDQAIVVINVQLRVFMRQLLSCPFRAVESLLALYKSYNPIFIVDVHGEATSEKLSLGSFLDGKVSAIFGTHTHVQTSDERVFKKGTGYITDVGMVGSFHSSLGIKFEKTICNFMTQMPVLFEIEEENPYVFSAIIFEIDIESTRCLQVKRILDFVDIA